MARLQDEIRADVKSRYEERILEAAIEVFLNHGYEESRVEQIAERAGVSAATIYRRYKSEGVGTKKKIMAALFSKFWEMTNEEIFEEVPKCKSTREKFEKIISIVIDVFRRYPDFGHVIVFNALWYLDVKLYRNDRIVEFKEFTRDLFDEAVSRGEVWPVNFDNLFEFYFCALEGSLRILGLKKRTDIDDYYGVSFSEDDLEQMAKNTLSILFLPPE
jgi:AcrR family transcriptional regulator